MIFETLDFLADSLSKQINIPSDQLRFVCCTILIIPMSHLFKYITNTQIRNYLSLILGILFQYFMYREQIFLMILQCVIFYVMLKNLGRKNVKWVILETWISDLSVQLYMYVYDYGGYRMHIQTMFMMNLVKFQSFAFCYQDGDKKNEDLSKYQQNYKITELPSFFDYMSYIYFFPGCLTGPGYEYVDFKNFIELKNRYQNIPSTVKASMIQFGLAISFLLVYVFFIPMVPESYVWTEDFKNQYLIVRMIYVFFCTMNRFRYYIAWTFQQASINGCGFSFNGYDKNNQPKWDAVLSADPYLELISNGTTKVTLWNASVANWVKNYIYFKICPENKIRTNPGLAQVANLGAFLASALWHGFYPGYYLCFIHWAFLKYVNNSFYKMSLNKFSHFTFYNSFWWWLVLNLYQNIMFNYFGIPFNSLRWDLSIEFFNNTQWCLTIWLLSCTLFFAITGYGQRAQKVDQEKSALLKSQ